MSQYDLSLKLSKHIKHFSANDKFVIKSCYFYAKIINKGNEPNTLERKTVNGGGGGGVGGLQSTNLSGRTG